MIQVGVWAPGVMLASSALRIQHLALPSLIIQAQMTPGAPPAFPKSFCVTRDLSAILTRSLCAEGRDLYRIRSWDKPEGTLWD